MLRVPLLCGFALLHAPVLFSSLLMPLLVYIVVVRARFVGARAFGVLRSVARSLSSLVASLASPFVACCRSAVSRV